LLLLKGLNLWRALLALVILRARLLTSVNISYIKWNDKGKVAHELELKVSGLPVADTWDETSPLSITRAAIRRVD